MDKPIEEEQPTQPVYRLSEIMVDRIGLVKRGANNLNWFLLKSNEEVTMPDTDITIEEVEAQVETSSQDGDNGPPVQDGFWEQAREYLQGLMKKKKAQPPMMDEDEEMTEAESEEDEDEEDEMADETKKAADVTVAESILKAQLDALQAQYDKNLEAVQKAVEEKYEARMTALQTEVEKAKAYADEQTHRAEKREYLEKAMAYRALPLATADLGDLLFDLAKTLPEERYQQIESLLKATDAQLGAAAIFGEIGTSRSPQQVELEDKVAKAATGGTSYKDALMGLSEAEQLQLLSELRGGV